MELSIRSQASKGQETRRRNGAEGSALGPDEKQKATVRRRDDTRSASTRDVYGKPRTCSFAEEGKKKVTRAALDGRERMSC
jgi:hypothetical protein